MAEQFPFSKRRIEVLEPPKNGRDEYRDSKTGGLVLRVTTLGVKSFSLFKKVDGRPVRITLGRFPDMTVEQARRAATDILAALNTGANPTAAKRARREAPTLQELFDHWIEHARQRKKTWPDDVRIFNKYMGQLKGRRLEDFSDLTVSTWHAKVGKDAGLYQANRCLALLSALFADAHRLGFDGLNPCRHVKRFKEESRDRFLLPNEMPAFFESLSHEEPTVRDFFWLALLTGARKTNLLTMRWDQLAMEGVWRIPITKNGDPVLVPLVDQAQNILRARRQAIGDCPWVFPGPGKAGHLVEVRKAWVRICKRAGLEDLRIHDLRRTLGSWQAAAGVSETIIGKSLGHKPGSKATAVYARLGLDPVREAMDNATDAIIEAGNGKGEDGGEPR